jgi:hypothetical protein
MNRIKIT